MAAASAQAGEPGSATRSQRAGTETSDDDTVKFCKHIFLGKIQIK